MVAKTEQRESGGEHKVIVNGSEVEGGEREERRGLCEPWGSE